MLGTGFDLFWLPPPTLRTVGLLYLFSINGMLPRSNDTDFDDVYVSSMMFFRSFRRM